MIEIIDLDQFTFFPLKFILIHICFAHETTDQVKCTCQPLVLFKLNFAKANDKVIWEFLFSTLEAMGMVQKFIALIQLMFKGVEIFVYINGSTTINDIQLKVVGRDAYRLNICSFMHDMFQLHDENNENFERYQKYLLPRCGW